MPKSACACGKTGQGRLGVQISSSIKNRETGKDTIHKLLDELDDLFPSGNGPVSLEQLRHELRGTMPPKHSGDRVIPGSWTNERRDRLLRLPEVIKRVGLKKSAIYDKIRRNEFPKPVAISKRARAWHASKIAQWIADRD